jgi:hypothetical protein
MNNIIIRSTFYHGILYGLLGITNMAFGMQIPSDKELFSDHKPKPYLTVENFFEREQSHKEQSNKTFYVQLNQDSNEYGLIKDSSCPPFLMLEKNIHLGPQELNKAPSIQLTSIEPPFNVATSIYVASLQRQRRTILVLDTNYNCRFCKIKNEYKSSESTQ